MHYFVKFKTVMIPLGRILAMGRVIYGSHRPGGNVPQNMLIAAHSNSCLVYEYLGQNVDS